MIAYKIECKKGSESVIEYVDHANMERICTESNVKKRDDFIIINGNGYKKHNIGHFENVTQEEIDMFSVGTIRYTLRDIYGKYKGNTVWKFTRYSEILRRPSEGRRAKKEEDFYFGYYTNNGTIVKVNESDIVTEKLTKQDFINKYKRLHDSV